MRPPRIAVLVLFLASSFFLLGRAITSTVRSPSSTYHAPTHANEKKKAGVWGYMYYNTPFSLFPPNAAISLTDDNSTSFAARPAAFGPKLHARGLSGQLWVGSGFSEETSDTDGELGCSDLPAWDSAEARKSLRNTLRAATAPGVSTSTRRTTHNKRASGDSLLDRDNRDAIAKSRQDTHHADDSTDDHLHERLSTSRHEASSHADIQSIQEGAEIEGKVVLLMRGGCGFLDKVMWAQRRGAVAVIVGDNRKGGPLIQMFAHGEEVDNVTIPSVFTARTTAQLLSSLTQPGSFIEDTLDERGNAILKVQQGSKPGKETKNEPELLPTTSAKKQKRSSTPRERKVKASAPPKRTWFSKMFGGSSSHGVDKAGRSSGDWVLVEDWNDEKDAAIQDSMDQSKSVDDDFIIGVHDWRDPDLIETALSKSETDEKVEATSDVTKKSKASNKSSGNSRSGKTSPDTGEPNPYKALPKSVKNSVLRDEILETSKQSRTLMGKMFGPRREGRRLTEISDDKDAGGENFGDPIAPGQPDNSPHEGLWVTIQPTSSASPFFDTLLVLVISPLVTLTVVYALLILRARIRRRRWRAPKSVVEQLPVRTYHTVAASPTPSPRQPSPSSTSPTTPLLQQSPPRRSRPRSRTTTGIPSSDSSLLTPASAIPTPPRTSSRQGRSVHEKGAGGFSAEWKKYMGRQVECVVCLEEYVDGVSRVMSLPCGHEFHAECITPWLTTRRRTCPICKGDVVRSLARGSSSSPRYDSYHDDSDEETSGEASGTRSTGNDSDLEQGVLSEPHESRQQDNWMSFWSSSFSPRRSRTPPPPEDRDR